jgi:hypothetical protein
MSKQQYKLVNPFILGKMNTIFTGKTQLEAATKSYNELSQYFNNDIPSFYFTMQKVTGKNKIGGGKNNEYLHFKVTEKKFGKKVDFKIKEVQVTKNGKQMTSYKKSLKKFMSDHQQKGGKKYSYDDDDDDDDDDDEEVYRPRYRTSTDYVLTQPLTHYYYDPVIYSTVFAADTYWYTPTFVAPLSPYIVGPATIIF